jgi:hypothetical protein
LKRRAVIIPDKVLHQQSLWWFAAFALFAVVAFWPSYFARLVSIPEGHVHLHGIVMFLWCAMFVFQAYLIRSGLKQTHRLVGKLSYGLVPLIVYAGLSLWHLRIKGEAGHLSNGSLYFTALVVNAAVVFVLLYGLAIYFRKTPAVHARFMVCTAFPLFSPVTDRLIFAYAPSLMGMVPVLDGNPLVQVVGFLLADALLVALSVWDWRANKRINVFPVALGITVAYHLSVLTFYKFSFWRVFSEWFVRLPLS